jgi:hypothetical protein
MSMQNTHTRTGPLPAIRDWVVKRGILYLLTQMPMIAFVVSVGFHWTTFPVATVYTVILAFVVLPIWVSYRRNRSGDPDEPANHFYKYALWALVPYVIYNISRIPTFYLFRVTFWDHWYGYGAQLTSLPPNQLSSLAAGTLIHSVQGYVLVLGYYILFPRRTLRSALVYVWVFLSLIYSTLFPKFILIDFSPGPRWYFVVWWAHFWMALAAWYVPKLYGGNFWSRLKAPAKALTAAVAAVVYLLPVIFVFWQATTWQFPLQRAIDNALFDRVQIVVNQDPVLVSKDPASGQTFYRFVLKFGPRIYTDYIRATKALDASPIQVSGRLLYKDEVIASCFSHIALLETPSNILVPSKYQSAVKRLDFSDIPVDCTGPLAMADRLGVGSSIEPVDVRWAAVATLYGDREKTRRQYSGSAPREAVAGNWIPLLLRPDPGAENLRRQVF